MNDRTWIASLADEFEISGFTNFVSLKMNDEYLDKTGEGTPESKPSSLKSGKHISSLQHS